MIIMSIVVGALETVPKSFEKGLVEQKIKGSMEIIHTTVLLRSSWIRNMILVT